LQNLKTQRLAEAGVMIAISYLLSLITLYQMPQGGALHPANLVPLLVFAFRWGGKQGFFTALTYGLVHFLLGMKFTLHPASIVLDYLLGFGFLGIAGFVKPDNLAKVLGGALLGNLGRLCCTVVSGAVVFASYAPKGQNPWLYSLIYNLTYVAPETLINLVVLALFYPKLKTKLLEFRKDNPPHGER
jgi:thiamine transporter